MGSLPYIEQQLSQLTTRMTSCAYPLLRGDSVKFSPEKILRRGVLYLTMRRKIIPYEPHLKLLARKLRNDSTYAEVLLWKELSGKQMLGYDFHRQKPLLRYIVDFYCPDLMLAIEIDGITHWDDEAIARDKERQKALEQEGVRFLRFNDEEVRKEMDGVLRTIACWIEKQHTPKPSLRGEKYK